MCNHQRTKYETSKGPKQYPQAIIIIKNIYIAPILFSAKRFTMLKKGLIATHITTKNLQWQIRLVVNYSPLCSFLHSLSCGCIFGISLRQCSRRKCEDFLNRAAFHYAKIFGWFGREINGTLSISALKFSGQSGPPRGLALFDRLVRFDVKLPFHLQKSRLQCQFAET